MQQKHEFSVGDRVEWLRTPRNALRGDYVVTGLLPTASDGYPQYRIRSDAEIADRMVSQNQICSRPVSEHANVFASPARRSVSL